MPRDVNDRTLPADPTEDMHAVTKQYCDANAAVMGVDWAEATTTAGIEKNWSTYDSFVCITQRIMTQVPLKVTKFTIDMNGTGTFDMALTNGPYSGEADLVAQEIVTDEVIESTGPHDFVPAENIMLSPGVYYVSIWHSDKTSSHQWNERKGSSWKGCALFFADEMYGDGTWQSDYGGQQLNLGMTAYKGTWQV